MDDAQAVVFDMDGVLLDSLGLWKGIIAKLLPGHDHLLSALDQGGLEGDKSEQWASFLRQATGVPLDEEEIISHVVHSVLAAYENDLPLLPGAREAVACLAASYPLAVASSSPRPVVAFVLERSGLAEFFAAWVSSDEVPRGKPAPDVYLEACERLGAPPERCVAVEDSGFGVQAAKAARMKVIAIPPPSEPLEAAAAALADHVLESIDLLCPDIVRSALAGEN
ncbi:MAG: HAD family phosphatase [Thermoleophilia bacterium]|nr:HAD family phosphatase [Thermoleophilia bacterium]